MRHLIILVLGLGILFNAQAEGNSCQPGHCLAVVDAGSSGSRLHIYTFDFDNNNQPIKIKELWSKKIKPGLATIEPNQITIYAYLNNIFSDAPEQNIPVYFYATAGMRLLPVPKQQQYYQYLQQWFSAQTQWPLVEAKTITGREEGVLGWLATNYQLGNFDSPEPSHDLPVVGVMDMGGASVQISFPVREVEHMDRHDLVSVNIAGHHVVLFVKSFLGLGQNVLSQQFLDNESCFADGYQLPSGLPAKGDANLCRHNVAKLINNVHDVNQVISPLLKGKASAWYAIGGVASLADDKLFSFENRQFSSQSLLEQIDSAVCHQQWKDIETPNNEFLYGYCLFAAYYYALMVDGYGINPEAPINLMPAEKNADWSLGVVLRHH